ncbi:UvrD-helicase domain-containing protein [Paraburkholderia fungorum]|uniref:UvrD-helicase domain-containing protein n=1 Tax=Paraburkholderia fungorum TaxID=134537 RepID=UPI0020970A79|nr:ATP-dependent helicase [Paraburkholderia fungorum]USX06673.1 ATP-dependent helicase [Paraburkholderia fungorum]
MITRLFEPTDEQRAAIEYAGSMVVTARPGSGKTAVVSGKIRTMLPSLRDYQGVVAISYTNKASDELEQRCKVGAVDTKRSFFGTIDEFCIKEIVRPFASHVFERRSDLRTVKAQELPAPLLALLPHKLIAEARVEDTSRFLPFLRACHAQGVIVLEAVGMLSYFIINESAACGRYIRAKYAAVFVDEYQDSGYFQHCLFVELKERGLCAVAVGDADQSIFQFARKDPAHLISLTRPESGFKPFSLTVNHRSHPSITAYARRLLDPNALYTADPGCQVYRVTVPGDQHAIAQWLGLNILATTANFALPSLDRVGVLCATSHTARIVADHIGISHRLHEEGPFSASPSHEANLFAELLAFRFDSRRNAQDVIQRHARPGLSSANERALRARIFQCRQSTIEALHKCLCHTTEAISGHAVSVGAAEQLREVCANANALRWFLPPLPDQVQILTLHKSKGLEFDIVYHLDLYDWILPRRKAVDGVWDPVFENEQQCLNLHYVGITRAVKACVLVSSTQRINAAGQLKVAKPSQFFGRNGVVPQLLRYVPPTAPG